MKWIRLLPGRWNLISAWIREPRNLNTVLRISFFGFVASSQFSISLSQIFGFIGLVAWLASLVLQRNWHQAQLPLWNFFGGFFLAYLLSTLFAFSPLASLSYCKRLLEPLVFFWALNGLSQLCQTTQVDVWQGSNKFLQQVVACLEKIKSAPLFSCLGLLILTAAITVFSAIPQIHEWGPTYRVRGPWTNPMTYGVILMMVLIVAVGWLLHRKSKRTGLVIAVVLLSIGIVVTHSRNAWVGLFFALCFLFGFKNRRALWAIPVFGLVAYGAAPGVIKDRINTFFQFGESGIHKRFEMWQAASDVIQDHPLLGCGYKCLFIVQDQYPEHKEIFSQFQNMHSNYVQLAVDMGLVGLAAWLPIWLGYLILMRKKWKDPDTNETGRCLILVASAEVLAFLVAGFFETHFYDQEIMMVFYFILALPFVKISEAESKALEPPSGHEPVTSSN